MSASDKAFCLILAIIIGGCVSNKAVERWHDVKMAEVRLEQDRILLGDNVSKEQ